MILTRKLSWRDVGDAASMAGIHIDEAARRFRGCGYRLMCFNGAVYKIDWDDHGKVCPVKSPLDMPQRKVSIEDTGFREADVE